MQDHQPHDRIQSWSVSKILAVIGISLVLATVSCMAAAVIDQQARPADYVG